MFVQDGTGFPIAQDTSTMSLDWTHLCAVSTTTNLSLYKNGVSVASTPLSVPIASGSNLAIGRRVGGTEFLNGSINEVGIWNRSLEDWEISALYNGSNGLSYDNFEGNLSLTNVSIKKKSDFIEMESNDILWIQPLFIGRESIFIRGNSTWNMSLGLTGSYNGADETLILCDDCNELGFSGYMGSDIGFGHFSTTSSEVGGLPESTSSTDLINLSFSITSGVTRSNIYLGVDSTPPQITKLLNYTSESFNINLSDYFTVSDSISGLSYCYIDWDHEETGESFVTNCTGNLSFNYSGHYNFTIETEDKAGLSPFYTDFEFRVQPRNLAYFYDAVTTTPLNNFNFTLTYPSGVEYDLTTDANGLLNFSSFDADVLQVGNYNLTLLETTGYLTPYVISATYNISQIPFNVSYNISRVNVTVNIYYRTNETVFNREAQVVLTEVFNSTTSNGSIFTNNVTIINGEYILYVSSDGYNTEAKTITYTSQESLNISVYLLENNNSNSGTLTVQTVDIAKSFMEGAKVSLKEYDVISKSYKEISECITNSDGECKLLIEVNTKSYIISASKVVNGNTLYGEADPEIFKNDVSGGEEVIFSEEVRTLTLTYTDDFKLNDIYNLNYNIVETFSNVTNISKIVTTFNTLDGTNIKICTQYYRYELGIKTNMSNGLYCIDSSSGIVTPLIDFVLNRSYTYVAEVYIDSENGKSVLESFRYSSINSLEELFKINAILPYFIIFLWVGIIVVGLLTKNMALTGGLAIALSWLEFIMFPSIIILSVTAFKTVLSLIFIFNSRKKEDFN